MSLKEFDRIRFNKITMIDPVSKSNNTKRKLSDTRDQKQFRGPAKSRPEPYFPSSPAFSGAFLPEAL
jgi:hypothetical protein